MELGSEDGQPSADLIQDLKENFKSFQFYQAVRLLQNAIALDASDRRVPRIGNEPIFKEGVVRFRSLQSLSFPGGDLAQFRQIDRDDESKYFELIVAFLGLTGPNGVLPAHYSSLVIERSHSRNKDYALRDFFDLFNHRAVSLFFRACEKYSLPFSYERSVFLENKDDMITSTFSSLIGLGVEGLRHRTSLCDEVLLYYSGLYSNRTRSAAGLEQILSTFFKTATRVRQYCPRWLFLPQESQSSFEANSGNMALGHSAIAGSKMKDIQSLFRVEMNLKKWSEFLEYLPGTKIQHQLVDLIHGYAGIDLDFEIQLTLPASEVPSASFSSEPEAKPLLGWTTWLGTPSSDRPIKDAVFRFGFGGQPLN